MTIDEPNKAEVISSDDNNVYLIFVEHRKWNEITDAKTKLIAKIWNAKKYIESDKFKEDYKGKKGHIILNTDQEPTKEIIDILKKEKVKAEKI